MSLAQSATAEATHEGLAQSALIQAFDYYVEVDDIKKAVEVATHYQIARGYGWKCERWSLTPA